MYLSDFDATRTDGFVASIERGNDMPRRAGKRLSPGRPAAAVQAGLALLPVTLLMIVFSRRFGALADRIGSRVLISLGALVASCGLLLLARVDQRADYLSEVLPALASWRKVKACLARAFPITTGLTISRCDGLAVSDR